MKSMEPKVDSSERINKLVNYSQDGQNKKKKITQITKNKKGDVSTNAAVMKE